MRFLFLCFAILLSGGSLAAQDNAPGAQDVQDLSKAGNDRVAEVIATFAGRGVMAEENSQGQAICR